MEKVKEHSGETATANRPSDPMVITRVFDARPERIWRAWTDENEVKKWWGPNDYSSPSCNIEARVGGRFLASMRGPDGKETWSTGTYKEMVPNRRIVVTDSFSDEKGNVIDAADAGMPGDWPRELLVTIDFEEQQGKTKMTPRHEGLPAEMKEPCRQGWSQSFDKMDAIL